MANENENLVEQRPEPTANEQVFGDTPLPPTTEPVPLPSTAESQEETAEHQAFNAEVEKEQAYQKRATGKGPR